MPTVRLQTRHLTVDLDDTGALCALVDRETGRPCLPAGVPAPLLTVRVDGADLPPERLERLQGDAIRLHYAGGACARIAVAAKPTHLVFRLQAIDAAPRVELVSWGPWPTTIGQTIGETVGVVRDGDVAIGIQALNPKTLGGRPLTDDDVMPSYDIFDSGNYADVSLEFRDQLLYRGDTAVAADHGSTLQAYCRDRSRDRVIRNWGHDAFVAPAYDDGGVIGSAVALFGCAADQVLPTLEAIELAEGLPHPMIDGEWAKTSRRATASYLITDFGEATLDSALAATRAAGLEYLYHSSPFETWGHFRLKPDLFPHGWDGFRDCVDRAAAAGVKIGFHTLSNFTTPNDPYVTPVPDPRLARVGSAALTRAIDAEVRTLGIDDPTFFRKKTTLNAVVLGDEIVTYRRVSPAAPWKLLGCERGAFGTTPAAHASGAEIGRLLDHPYRVLLTDADLAQEQARRIADFCNRTGARQLSFDGLEGNWSTGMGQYGRTLFTQAWYDALAPALRGTVVNDASNPGHYNWHTYTRMNWGEPWYAGFRESQTLYRLKNQFYYSRNLMPRMLGWFALRGDTSIEDAEWLLARAAGFDAGFSLATDIAFAGDQVLPGHEVERRGRQSNLQVLLAAVRRWEAARMAGAFPEDLKPELQDVGREFHLQEEGDGWSLVRVHSEKARLHRGRRTLPFDNPHAAQAPVVIARNTGTAAIEDMALSVGGRRVALGPQALAPEQTLKLGRDGEPVVHDASWGVVTRLTTPVELSVARGPQRLRFDWAPKRPGQFLQVEVRTQGPPLRLQRGA